MKQKFSRYRKYMEAVDSFRKCLKDIFVLKAELEEEVKNADYAMGDCRHKLELDYPTSAKERTRICKAIHKSGEERRVAKDCLAVLDEFIKFTELHPKLSNELDAVYGKMTKSARFVEGPRSYRTRVLSDMFGNEITEKDEIT